MSLGAGFLLLAVNDWVILAAAPVVPAAVFLSNAAALGAGLRTRLLVGPLLPRVLAEALLLPADATLPASEVAWSFVMPRRREAARFIAGAAAGARTATGSKSTLALLASTRALLRTGRVLSVDILMWLLLLEWNEARRERVGTMARGSQRASERGCDAMRKEGSDGANVQISKVFVRTGRRAFWTIAYFRDDVTITLPFIQRLNTSRSPRGMFGARSSCSSLSQTWD